MMCTMGAISHQRLLHFVLWPSCSSSDPRSGKGEGVHDSAGPAQGAAARSWGSSPPSTVQNHGPAKGTGRFLWRARRSTQPRRWTGEQSGREWGKGAFSGHSINACLRC